MVLRPSPICNTSVGRAPPTPATTIVEFCMLPPSRFPSSTFHRGHDEVLPKPGRISASVMRAVEASPDMSVTSLSASCQTRLKRLHPRVSRCTCPLLSQRSEGACAPRNCHLVFPERVGESFTLWQEVAHSLKLATLLLPTADCCILTHIFLRHHPHRNPMAQTQRCSR